MLKIKNITKLYKKDIGEWRIGKVEETNYCYLIQLYKADGDRMQVNLERSPIGAGRHTVFELWYWSGMSKLNNNTNAIPERILLPISILKDYYSFLYKLNLLINK